MKKVVYLFGIFTILVGSTFAVGGFGKGYEKAPHYYQQNTTCVDCQNHTYNHTYYHHYNYNYSYKYNGTLCNGSGCNEYKYEYNYRYNGTLCNGPGCNEYKYNYNYKYNGTLCNGSGCNEYKYNYNHKYNRTHNQSNVGKRGINGQSQGNGMSGRGMNNGMKNAPNHARDHAKMGRMKAEHARKMMEIAKKTYQRFEQVKQNWLRIRQMCERNESKNCSLLYFQATKELLLTTINATIERLKTLNDTNVSEYIEKLEEYKEFVENSENISEIRKIYPEIKEYIREANRLFALKGYETLIDSYYDYALSLQDKYPEQVQEIISELDQLKEQLNELTPREIVMKLREIRGKLVALIE